MKPKIVFLLIGTTLFSCSTASGFSSSWTSSAQTSWISSGITTDPSPEESSITTSSSEKDPQDLSEGASITYWCPNTDTDLFRQKAIAFKKLHPEYSGSITNLATLGESDVKQELVKNPEVAADIFEIADDTISACVDARAMTSFSGVSDAKWIRELYGETAVEATTIKGQVFGLPYRNDNGYVLVYDQTIVSDEQAKTIEGIVSACKAKGAVFGFDLTNSWYTFAPVWGAGGKTYTDSEGAFRSEIATDAIAKAVGAFGKIVRDAGTTWVHSDNDSKFGIEGAGRIGAVIKWNNYASEKKSSARLCYAPLPSFTVDTISYTLKTAQSFKALGMRRANAFTEAKKIVALEFAKFMGSDEVSEIRLTQLGQGVSNKTVIAKTDLWTNPWMSALAKMSATSNTVSWGNNSNNSFWSPAKSLGEAIKAGTIIDQATAKQALQTCQQAQAGQN